MSIKKVLTIFFLKLKKSGKAKHLYTISIIRIGEKIGKEMDQILYKCCTDQSPFNV